MMNTLKMVLVVALALATTNVAQADEQVEVQGFDQACTSYMRDKLCSDAPKARTAAAPASDPKVDALGGEVAALRAELADLKSAQATAPAAKPDAPKAARKGPSLGKRVAALEAKLDKAATPQGVSPDELAAIRQAINNLRKEMGDGLAKEREERDQGDAAQSARTDKHGQMLTELSDRLDGRIDGLREKRRPIEFALYAAPLLLTAADLSGQIEISYFGITPQLLIPIHGRTSLEFEASLLIGNDEKNPFGTFVRAGVGYQIARRAHAVAGLGLLMASIDDHLEAELAVIVGTAGMRFGLGDVKFLNYGFDIMLGNELNSDHDQALTMGARALVGVRLPE